MFSTRSFQVFHWKCLLFYWFSLDFQCQPLIFYKFSLVPGWFRAGVSRFTRSGRTRGGKAGSYHPGNFGSGLVTSLEISVSGGTSLEIPVPGWCEPEKTGGSWLLPAWKTRLRAGAGLEKPEVRQFVSSPLFLFQAVFRAGNGLEKHTSA